MPPKKPRGAAWGKRSASAKTRRDTSSQEIPSESAGDFDCYVQMAIVGRPHGIRGALTLWPHNPSSTWLIDAFQYMSRHHTEPFRIVLVPPDDAPTAYEEWDINDLRSGRKGSLQVMAAHIADRDVAAAYRGWRVLIPKAALPQLNSDDEFYFHQLEGAPVELESGEAFGIVRRIVETSCEVLEIRRDGGGELLVPVLKDTVKDLGPPVVLYDHALEWFDMGDSSTPDSAKVSRRTRDKAPADGGSE